MELGYPSTKQLGRWVRIYEEKGDLPRELKPRERYSRTQKIAAVEHYRGLRSNGTETYDNGINMLYLKCFYLGLTLSGTKTYVKV